MRIIVTAGPTREHIDSVRFITNASSGRMGCAVAAAAVLAGHDVTLLVGRLASAMLAMGQPPGKGRCRVISFDTVADLRDALEGRFEDCDALVMAAAVGDFRPEKTFPGKLSRAAGAVTVRLLPTEDILAGLSGRKRPGQIVVAFAVEDGPTEAAEAKARAEMAAKGADYVVVNTPAAMAAEESSACILAPAGRAVPWATRTKTDLGREVIALIETAARSAG